MALALALAVLLLSGVVDAAEFDGDVIAGIATISTRLDLVL